MISFLVLQILIPANELTTESNVAFVTCSRQLISNRHKPIGFAESEIADFQSSPHSGLVLGFDLAAIAPLPGASFLSHANIYSADTRDRISRALNRHLDVVEKIKSGADPHVDGVEQISTPSSKPSRCVDVVMSDMAPNCSGFSAHDHENICKLARGAYDLAAVFLKAS